MKRGQWPPRRWRYEGGRLQPLEVTATRHPPRAPARDVLCDKLLCGSRGFQTSFTAPLQLCLGRGPSSQRSLSLRFRLACDPPPRRLPRTALLRAARSEAREWGRPLLGWLQEGSRSVGPFRFGLEFLGRLLSMRGLGEAQLERASSRSAGAGGRRGVRCAERVLACGDSPEGGGGALPSRDTPANCSPVTG